MVVVCVGDIWWLVFVVTICCHFFCLVGEGKWLACQMCPQISLFLQVVCIPIVLPGIERDFQLFDEFAVFAIDK